MSLAGFEPKISACERPQTHALDRAATGIGKPTLYYKLKIRQETSSCHEILVREGYDLRNKLHIVFLMFN